MQSNRFPSSPNNLLFEFMKIRITIHTFRTSLSSSSFFNLSTSPSTTSYIFCCTIIFVCCIAMYGLHFSKVSILFREVVIRSGCHSICVSIDRRWRYTFFTSNRTVFAFGSLARELQRSFTFQLMHSSTKSKPVDKFLSCLALTILKKDALIMNIRYLTFDIMGGEMVQFLGQAEVVHQRAHQGGLGQERQGSYRGF